MPQRTYQPNNRRRAKAHGFRQRMKTRGGRLVLKARRQKDASAFLLSTTKTPSAFLKLKNSAEFQSVYRRGAKKASRSFVVFVAANGLGYTRVGFTTPRKLGIAVQRNRVRRRLREIFAWRGHPSRRAWTSW